LAIVLVLLLSGAAVARSVVMVEKRQALGGSSASEATKTVKLADGKVVQLVTCCGLNQDDSAIYTVRDADGYTLVDRRFPNGRFFLSPEGRLISVLKSGPAYTLTFHDYLLKVIRQMNLVSVQSITVGENGSVAVLTKQPDGALLRVFDSEGQSRWELKNAPLGAVFFLPQESRLALTADRKLSLFPLAGGNPRTMEAPGPVQFIGADAARKLIFLAVDLREGGEVWALDDDALTAKWKHRLADAPAGHCQSMVVDLSRYLSDRRLIALLLRCPGERQMFYVARFLNDEGQMLGQEKLGRRVETSFYEVKNTVAILSDGFVYSFAVRD
jgi:hypothetical protein